MSETSFSVLSCFFILDQLNQTHKTSKHFGCRTAFLFLRFLVLLVFLGGLLFLGKTKLRIQGSNRSKPLSACVCAPPPSAPIFNPNKATKMENVNELGSSLEMHLPALKVSIHIFFSRSRLLTLGFNDKVTQAAL